MLTQERLKEILHYDPATGIFTWIVSPSKNVKSGSVPGTLYKNHSGNEYLRVTIKRRHYRLHRLAWLYVYGDFPELIDHINGNGLDNRIENLRSVSSSENSRNTKLSVKSKYCVHGITKVKNRYKVVIGYQMKQIYIGSFRSVDDAVRARKDAELKYGFHENHGRIMPAP